MSRILNTAQCRQLDADMAELEAYRALGMTPDKIAALLFPDPAPLPLPLHDDDDFSLGAGLLADDGYDPALEAAGRRENEQWHK